MHLTTPHPDFHLTSASRRALRPLGLRRLMLPLLMTAVASLTGCFSSSSAKDKHAVFHGCSSSQVEITELSSEGHTRYQTSGCGHVEVFSCIAAKCRSARILVARQHASDFKCKLEEVTTEEPSPNQFVSKGCGQTGNYACSEVDGDVVRCAKRD